VLSPFPTESSLSHSVQSDRYRISQGVSRIENWGLLGDQNTKQILMNGGVLKRGTRYSLTCRDVKCITSAKSFRVVWMVFILFSMPPVIFLYPGESMFIQSDIPFIDLRALKVERCLCKVDLNDDGLWDPFTWQCHPIVYILLQDPKILWKYCREVARSWPRWLIIVNASCSLRPL